MARKSVALKAPAAKQTVPLRGDFLEDLEDQVILLSHAVRALLHAAQESEIEITEHRIVPI
jgi:hypothetical protein